MSVGFIGSKHTVFDIYPLRKKRVFLLVDPQNIMGETADFHATLDTITHLLNREASVVIAASFGPLAGITLNLSKREREGALNAFHREGGMGYTNFFSTLDPAVKVDLLNSIPGLQLTRDLGRSTANTGKTTLFAGLSSEKKRHALRHYFSKQEFLPCSTYPFVDALQGRFPGVKVHFSQDCVRAPLHTVAPGEIMVLENLRFYRNEMSQDPEERQAMAEVLASEVDLFINDSFAGACGVFASNVELPRLMQHGAAGQSMDRELAFYSKFLSHPARPLAVVIAGSSVINKLQLIRSLVGRVDRIFVAGAAAYPFLMAKGLSCGLGYPASAEQTIRCGKGRGGNSGHHHHGGHRTTYKRNSVVGTAAPGSSGVVGGGGGGGGGSSSPHNGNSLLQNASRNSASPLSNVLPEAGRDSAGHLSEVAAAAITADSEEVVRVRRPGDIEEENANGNGVRNEVPASAYAKEILDLCKQYDVEVVLPIDHIVTTDPDGSRSAAVLVESTAVPHDVYSMDCGINTINYFARALRDCRTVFWTGALGWASKGYTSGTSAFATMLGKENIVSIVGGRYTSQVVMESGVAGKILHVSSGGISSLEILQGNPLPGVQALSDVAPQAEVSTISVHELVRNLPMFIGCNSHQLKLIAKKFVRRALNKGDYVLYRGDRHTCLTLVAQGGLVARCGEEFTSAPARYIPKGMTASTYSFVTQAPAMETIRAALNGTVVYQLFSSALNELLNAHPDLAAQLFQNLSEPLRVIANEDYRRQQSSRMVVKRNACRTRVPVLATVPAGSGIWEDIVQDVISTVALQSLSVLFTPYVAKLDVELPMELQPAAPSLFTKLLGRISRHEQLGTVIVSSVVRNVIYHQIIHRLPQPWMAAVLSSSATAPLRLLSYGIKYNDVNFKLILDEGLIDAAASVAPQLAYSAALEVQLRVERFRKRRMNSAGRAAIMSLVKLLLGFAVFPVVYQRNFVYTQPSASRFWEPTAFRAYELKQVLALFLRYVVHNGIKMVSR